MFIAPLSQYGQSYYLKKVNTSQLLLPQYQNTYPRGPESTGCLNAKPDVLNTY